MISPLNLSQFEIVKKVGQGGFGKVFEVKNKTSGQIFAAKVALFSLENESKDTIRSLSREVNIISKLNHPSIVKFIGYSPLNFKEKPNPVIITEFLTNGSLGDILKLERKGLCDVGWNETKKIINIFGIASAMSYLHSNNIIHRDLKPDNILMNEYLLPKITDFGLSKVKHTNDESMSLQSTTSLKGTPIYIAPEIWSKYEYTKEGDVYAFAFIVYEIMTLEEPYNNCDYFSLMTNVLNGIRPEIVSIPECYKNLIEKCWDQNPLNRPTFDQIVDELKNNEEFITDLIEEDDYFQYIEYIEKCTTSFDSKNHINITDFIKGETKTFQKIEIDKHLITMMKNEEDNNNEEYDDDDESSTSSSAKNPKKDNNKKLLDINVKKKELPFKLPPDDPTVTKYRELLYRKLYALPKENMPQAIYTYALLTNFGNHLPKNIKEANIFYKIAADMGHVDSMWYYASSLEEGKGIEMNTKEADRYFEMAIEKGSVDAMYLYGQYLFKRSNKSDQKKSVHYYKMAANKGEPGALHDLGCLYAEGVLVDRDPEKSLKYYKLSAKKGYTKAIRSIGLIYQNGDGVPINLEKAFSYMKLAADKGDAEAINAVGLMYENGQGTKKNVKKAIKYYNNSIEKGCTNAMVNLGSLYYKTNDEEKYDQAYELFKKAADLNNTKGMINLHFMYYNGAGRPVNKEEGLKYLQKAVDLGDVLAIRTLGTYYKQGNGVPVDLKKCFEYYKMAADLGSPDDMFLAGLELVNGSGFEQNPEMAAMYFKKGADSYNHELCMISYADLLYHGSGVTKNEEEAVRYYTMAKNRGNKIAWGRLGSVLLDKDPNSQEGIDLLKKGASLGDVDAMSKLAGFYQDSDERPQEDFDQSLCYSMLAYSTGNTGAMSLIYNLILKNRIQKNQKQNAIEFVKKAADLGDTNAMVAYVTYTTNNCEPTPEILNEQVRYSKLAADNGNSQGMVIYGILLQNGHGIEQNIDEAMHYFKMAADLGNEAGENLYNNLADANRVALQNVTNHYLQQIHDLLRLRMQLEQIAQSANNNNSNNNLIDNNNANNANDDSISSSLSMDSNNGHLDRNITTIKSEDSQKKLKCSQKHPICFCMVITFVVMICAALVVFMIYTYVFS